VVHFVSLAEHGLNDTKYSVIQRFAEDKKRIEAIDQLVKCCFFVKIVELAF
jgi:hypothetical protein